MATIQRSTTKSGSRLINYVKNEEKATVKSGHNLDIERAKEQMELTRHLYSKNDGIQAHHVVQSFKPDEITPEKANEIGLELAEKIAKEHEVAVYTHNDRDHIHNHIVINSINLDTGNKYQTGGKKGLYEIREKSDEICLEHDLSIVQNYNASIRYTLAEKELLEKGQSSWKDEIRQAINYERDNATSFDDLKARLKQNYDIDTKLRGKTLSYKHPDQQKYVRSKKLGHDYEKEALENVITRQVERKQEYERLISRNEGTERTDDELYQSSHERGNGERSHNPIAIGTDSREVTRGHEQDAIDFEQARKIVNEQQRKFRRSFNEWTRSNTQEQSEDDTSVTRDRGRKQREIGGNERNDNEKHKEYGKQKQRSREKSKERGDELSL